MTYAAKLSKAEAELDFRRPAAELAARVRAFNPWPVAWCAFDGDRLRLLLAEAHGLGRDTSPAAPGTLLDHDDEALRIACGPDGREVLRVTRAQLPGGKALPVSELLRARADRFPPGLRLGHHDQETPA